MLLGIPLRCVQEAGAVTSIQDKPGLFVGLGSDMCLMLQRTHAGWLDLCGSCFCSQ